MIQNTRLRVSSVRVVLRKFNRDECEGILDLQNSHGARTDQSRRRHPVQAGAPGRLGGKKE